MFCLEINAYFAVKFRYENPFASAQNLRKDYVIFGKFEPRLVLKIIKTLRRLILPDRR